jgi:hypothetical protein
LWCPTYIYIYIYIVLCSCFDFLRLVYHMLPVFLRSSLKIRNWKRFQTNESRQSWRKNVYMIVNSCFCTTSMYYCTWIYYRNKISVVTINLPFNNEIGWLQHSDSPSDDHVNVFSSTLATFICLKPFSITNLQGRPETRSHNMADNF